MANPLTRGLLIAATLLGGLLAGGNIDRAIVQNSAGTSWERLLGQNMATTLISAVAGSSCTRCWVSVERC